MANALRTLRRVRDCVVSDPDILGGAAVFRGTRVPVHLIATLIGQGSTETDLLEAYPRLTAEMVHLAPTYAAAYPPGGAPARSHGMVSHRYRAPAGRWRRSGPDEISDR
ncbi:MAG: DUF433 domain-containing protein [Proteobacteria bacterium]|nr:DUF433 domain-containing protein [Pseudomonadota bacterium]